MKILMLILSIMAWTVTGNKSVSGTGDVPQGIEADYNNTYNKGQVRANDTATLTLRHLPQITVERIDVYIKSNKSSGAGLFTVTANEMVIATKSGSMMEWVGSYDNQQFHELTLFSGVQEGVSELQISLLGTDNSLYIEKYVIYYSFPPARTVILMNGSAVYDQLTQQESGAAVLLPSLPDVNEWHFAAWTTQPFYTISTKPDAWINPGPYYPSSDCTLWAVYEYLPDATTTYATNLQSGVYIYLESIQANAIAGTPDGGIMAYAGVNIHDTNQHYYIEFNATCDSATIMHENTGTYIGYKGTQLIAARSLWCVYHHEDKTAFYCVVNGKTYVLWPTIYKNDAMFAGLYSTNAVSTTTTVLLPVTQAEEPSFTCYPETGRGIENVPAEEHSVVIPLGNYEIRISNGKKTISL